jgi:hypothetical protein
MEYIFGSLITAFTFILFFKYIKPKFTTKSINIDYTQTHIYEVVKNFLPDEMFDSKIPNSQTFEYIRKTTMKILFFKDQAYWINNNQLFTAKMLNGEINQDSIIEVDTMGMDKVQLDNILFVVEQLRNGPVR